MVMTAKVAPAVSDAASQPIDSHREATEDVDSIQPPEPRGTDVTPQHTEWAVRISHDNPSAASRGKATAPSTTTAAAAQPRHAEVEHQPSRGTIAREAVASWEEQCLADAMQYCLGSIPPGYMPRSNTQGDIYSFSASHEEDNPTGRSHISQAGMMAGDMQPGRGSGVVGPPPPSGQHRDSLHHNASIVGGALRSLKNAKEAADELVERPLGQGLVKVIKIGHTCIFGCLTGVSTFAVWYNFVNRPERSLSDDWDVERVQVVVILAEVVLNLMGWGALILALMLHPSIHVTWQQHKLAWAFTGCLKGSVAYLGASALSGLRVATNFWSLEMVYMGRNSAAVLTKHRGWRYCLWALFTFGLMCLYFAMVCLALSALLVKIGLLSDLAARRLGDWAFKDVIRFLQFAANIASLAKPTSIAPEILEFMFYGTDSTANTAEHKALKAFEWLIVWRMCRRHGFWVTLMAVQTLEVSDMSRAFIRDHDCDQPVLAQVLSFGDHPHAPQR
mmetsp:Transcript_20972/g.45913  ORF Transcript_20972/g.45913 Transcript_20972/m.45913 type:complete len:503 (-) Transcript_20972:1261-2769(-)